MPYERTVVSCDMQELEKTDYATVGAVLALTTGRSGTVWLTKVLSQLQTIHVAHEPFPPLFYEHRRHMDGNTFSTRADCARMLRVARAEPFRGAQYVGACYVELAPWWTFLAEEAMEAWARVKFLHLYRDPRKFVTSALTRDWFKKSGNRLGHAWPNSKYPERWKQAIDFWVRINRRALELGDAHPERVLSVRSEDLWKGPQATQRIMEFCGTPEEYIRQSATVIVANLDKVANPVNEERRVKWAPYWDKFLEEHAGDVVERLGYSLTVNA